MADQITPVVEPVVESTPIVAAPTPTAAVDMDAITKAAESRAERAAQAAVKDMLKQSGLDDAAVKTMLDEWKSKQVTPEQVIKQHVEANTALQQKLTAVEQEKAALAKGVPLGSTDEATKTKAKACITLARSYVSPDVTFEEAIDIAMSVISFAAPKQTPPPMWAGAGTKPIRTALSEKDEKKRKYLGLK